MAKLIIQFKDSTRLVFEHDAEWCKKAFEEIILSMKKPKDDIFVFSNRDGFSKDAFRLSEIEIVNLIKGKDDWKN